MAAGELSGGYSFHFANFDHVSMTGVQPRDLPQPHGISFAMLSNGPQGFDAGPGAMEGHTEHDHLASAGGVPNAELNWAHFHLV
jgi:hypothetical protein